MTEVDVVELSLAIVAVIIAGVGLTVGSAALAIVIGIKNSTHQVVWKTLEEPKDGPADPFGESFSDSNEEPESNPNRKLNKKTKPTTQEASEVNPDEEDMTSASNNWL